MDIEAMKARGEGNDASPAPPEAGATPEGNGHRGNEGNEGNEAKVPRGKMPRTIGAFTWAVILASFALSATTWIALGELAGFRESVEVNGITLRLAWLMPVVVDGYVVVALLTWMAPVPPEVQKFARTNTYVAAAVGVIVQSAYHATMSTGFGVALALLIGAMPPGFAAVAIHLRTVVIRRAVPDHGRAHATHATPAPRLEAGQPSIALPSSRPAGASTPGDTPAPKASEASVPKARATRAPRAKAKATAEGKGSASEASPDDLASRRLGHDVARLRAEWGGNEPPPRKREAAKAILRAASPRADAAVAAYEASLTPGRHEATEVAR